MFDFTDVEVSNDFDPIPTGEYPVCIESAEWKTSKAGAEYLNIQFKVFGENYDNRRIFNIYNLFHPKDQVRNIAMGDLKKLLMAAGYEEMNFDSKEKLIEAILPARMMLRVGQKRDDYGLKNTVKGYGELKEQETGVIPF